MKPMELLPVPQLQNYKGVGEIHDRGRALITEYLVNESSV
jgi:hypothetical protein